MSLDQLWAGWRASYVSSVSGPLPPDEPLPGSLADGVAAAESSCVFCQILSSDAPDEERRVVHHGTLTVAMLNAYPYASGHLLVMPVRHVADLDALSEEEGAELWALTRQATTAITAAYGPDGMNLGANLGRAAGAGLPRHLHLHVLPRWVGDTNFMTTVASVRVLPEPLSDSWVKLRASWPQ